MRLSKKYYNLLVMGAFLIIAAVLPRQVSADVVGESHGFSISPDYDAQSRSKISATMRLASDHAYFYIEDDYWNSISQTARDQLMDQITALSNEFNGRIYPIETNFFGSEPNPGIDNDPHITIMIAPLVNYAGGYFDTANEQPKIANALSNEREIVYVNVLLINNQRRIFSFLAHEFQHMISYNQKELLRHVTDDVWLNELRSEYAVTLLGYNEPYQDSNLQRRVDGLLQDPSDSLTEWKNQVPDYGQIAIFGDYLAKHWSPAVIADTIKSDQIGIPSIQEGLHKEGFTDSFADVYIDWLIADYINDPSHDTHYGYIGGLGSLHVSPTKIFNAIDDQLTITISGQYKDWQGRWFDYASFAPGSKSVFKIGFSSSSLASFIVPYLVFKNDGSMEAHVFDPTDNMPNLLIPGIGTSVSRVLVMPFKKDKIANFSADENTVDFSMTAERVATETMPTPTPTPPPVASVKPSDFGLHEGDFIRAAGDNDIYVINDYGYKRLILNPAICLMYGHLRQRGCFAAVHSVTAQVRDAFKTSWYVSNGEIKDNRVYILNQIDDDHAKILLVEDSFAQFAQNNHDIHSIFFINSKEQSSYPRG